MTFWQCLLQLYHFLITYLQPVCEALVNCVIRDEVVKILKAAGAKPISENVQELAPAKEIETLAKEFMAQDYTIKKSLNWPSFRGEFASGIADGQNPVTKWDAVKGIHIKWKKSIAGLGHSGATRCR